MKTISFSVTLFCLLAVPVIYAGPGSGSSGKEVFKAKGCMGCHNPTVDQADQGLGPSIAQLARAYATDRPGLIAFLKGNGQPRVYPDKVQVMQPMRELIHNLPDYKFEALADFILSHAQR